MQRQISNFDNMLTLSKNISVLKLQLNIFFKIIWVIKDSLILPIQHILFLNKISNI